MYIAIEMDDRKRIELDGVKTAEEARAEVEEIREPWIWSVVIDGACCGLDIIGVIFEREYPELADSVDYDGPIWREFDYEFAYGPFEGQEGFGAYFEKKYYDRWSRELTRYDDEGRTL